MVKYLIRLDGQAVKTPPSHGGNRGSIPRRAADINIACENAMLICKIVNAIDIEKIRLDGQAVKTPPSHGGNRGSIPRRAADISIACENAMLICKIVNTIDNRKDMARWSSG